MDEQPGMTRRRLRDRSPSPRRMLVVACAGLTTLLLLALVLVWSTSRESDRMDALDDCRTAAAEASASLDSLRMAVVDAGKVDMDLLATADRSLAADLSGLLDRADDLDAVRSCPADGDTALLRDTARADRDLTRGAEGIADDLVELSGQAGSAVDRAARDEASGLLGAACERARETLDALEDPSSPYLAERLSQLAAEADGLLRDGDGDTARMRVLADSMDRLCDQLSD